jgi:hypothetical protein
MKAYVITTGVLFGLLVVAHVMRAFEEGAHVLTNPMWLLITLLAAGLCLWSWQVLRGASRAERRTP